MIKIDQSNAPVSLWCRFVEFIERASIYSSPTIDPPDRSDPAEQYAPAVEYRRADLAQTPARVVIHVTDDSGFPSIYIEGDAEVYTVDEFAPDDRIYRHSKYPIPEALRGSLDTEPIGTYADDPDKHAQAIRTVNKAIGGPKLVGGTATEGRNTEDD